MKNKRKLSIMLVMAILTLVRIQVASAQEDTWTSGGPYEASVTSTAIDPADSMHLYIGTNNFVFETTNGGADWLMISTRDSPEVNRRQGVQSVNIHPYGPDTMFMATARGAYKSADAGQTWSQMFQQWPKQLWHVSEITRGNPPVLFLGTVGSAWRSTDCGRNWIQMGWLTGSIPAIKADPVNPNIVYAANNTTIPNTSIWKSTDAGLTWQNIHHNLQYDAGSGAFGRRIEVDPVDPDIIYFSRACDVGEEVLVKSINAGESWTDITPPGLVENRLNGIAVSPVDHNTVLVCSVTNGVLRSADGGATWEEANQGIIGISRQAVSLTADPRTGFIYLGWYAGGIYRSGDDGQSWEKISYNITGAKVEDLAANSRNSDTLYSVTYNGLYISTDGAASWQYIELDLPRLGKTRLGGVEVDLYDPSYVYVSYYGYDHPDDNNPDGAFYRSTDGGATWEAFTQGLIPRIYQYYGHIAVANYGGGWRRLYLASRYGLYSSDDLGESWSLCGGGLPVDQGVTYIAVSPVIPDLVFVGCGSGPGSLYRTGDGGMTWEQLSNIPPDNLTVRGIACDPVDPDIIFLNMNVGLGVFKSTDGGLTWDDFNHNLPLPPGEDYWSVSGMAINPLNHDNVFIWLHNRGIFQSHNGGEQWVDFNLNMETCFPSARGTLIDPTDTSRVFLGLRGGSVQVITRTLTDIDDAENILPTVFTSSSYPNPFNAQTIIEYALPEVGQVEIEIFDLLGRKLVTLVNEEQEAGRHRVIWDAKDRASGVYFYKIDIGESSEMKKMVLLK